jgi:hypothetical protein
MSDFIRGQSDSGVLPLSYHFLIPGAKAALIGRPSGTGFTPRRAGALARARRAVEFSGTGMGMHTGTGR